jgi:hypothetical protein
MPIVGLTITRTEDGTTANGKRTTENEKPANEVELIIDRLSVVSF